MKKTLLIGLVLLGCVVTVTAQDEAELEQAIELLRQQGMNPTQLEQLEQQLRSLQAVEAQRNQQRKDQAASRARQRLEQSRSEQRALAESLKAKPNTVMLGIGAHRAALTVRACSATSHERPGLQVVAEAIAEGSFRGESVVLSMIKAHPLGAPGAVRDEFFLYQMQIEPEEASLSFQEVVRRRDKALSAYSTEKQQEAMARYPITDDMTLDELNAQMAKQQAAMDAVRHDVSKREIKKALSHGTITAQKGIIEFQSTGLYSASNGKTPDVFFDLESAQIRAVAQCAPQ
ncbi:MAG: hypothetical protein AAF465_10515 [Pseudomonadota bacterium]